MISCHLYLGTAQVSNVSDQQNSVQLKTALYRSQTRVQISPRSGWYCADSQLSTNCQKIIFVTCKITYMDLNFDHRLKLFTITSSLENVKNRQKSKNQNFEPRFQKDNSTFSQNFDVCDNKLLRYSFKKDFKYTLLYWTGFTRWGPQ